MTPITRILAPVDLSQHSIPAAAYAAALARHFGAELVLVHAFQGRWPLERNERLIRDRIATMAAGGSRFLFREGSPASVILNTAAAEKAGLVVMSTRSRPPFSRFFDESITAEVLREAPCAVWAGLDDPSPLSQRPIRTVVCALALSPRAGDVLRRATDLAACFNAGLCIVHASKSLECAPQYPCDREWRLWMRKMARQEIRSIQADAGTSAEVWLEAGRPLDTIPPLAASLRADLLVIGRSPRRRLMSDLRTLSYKLASRTPCPVVSV